MAVKVSTLAVEKAEAREAAAEARAAAAEANLAEEVKKRVAVKVTRGSCITSKRAVHRCLGSLLGWTRPAVGQLTD